MEEKIELRNCPFCGGLPVFETKNVVLRYYPRQELDHYQVKCTICLEHNVDLTALDGLKDHGRTKSKMSLLTLAQYQEYVKTLDEYKLDKWWWLATPWSTPKHGYETTVLCVSPRGFLYDGICVYYRGVRPFCILKSNIFVSE